MKADRLLKVLMDGNRAEIGGYTYCFDINYQLCVVAHNETKNEEMLLKVNFGGVTIAQFIAIANKVTDDEEIIIGVNAVLNEIGRKTFVSGEWH